MYNSNDKHDKEINVFKRFMKIWVGACVTILCVGAFVPSIIIYGQLSLLSTFLIVMFTVAMAAFLILLLVKFLNVMKTLRPKNYFFSLDEEDFKCLVRGGTLTIDDPGINQTYNLIIKDIGFHQMERGIELAMQSVDIYKARQRPHTNA